MIDVQGLTKKYGKFVANDDITLSVNSGELAVILGPNGAGKSTLIKSICGLLRFQGSATIGGYENRTIGAKQILGYVPEFPVLYPMLTVAEHLEFIAKAYRLNQWEERAESLLHRFELDDKKMKLGKELSKGMQQKVSVCCALLPQPKALILDEPLVGLDPHGIRQLKIILSELRNSGCALLVSTHMIESVEDNWDVTYIIVQGKIKQVCRRENIDANERLEDIYFQITEGKGLDKDLDNTVATSFGTDLAKTLQSNSSKNLDENLDKGLDKGLEERLDRNLQKGLEKKSEKVSDKAHSAKGLDNDTGGEQ